MKSDHFLEYNVENDNLSIYRIRGLFGGDFNLAVWRITSESPNLNRAILKLNQLLYRHTVA